MPFPAGREIIRVAFKKAPDKRSCKESSMVKRMDAGMNAG